MGRLPTAWICDTFLAQGFLRRLTSICFVLAAFVVAPGAAAEPRTNELCAGPCRLILDKMGTGGGVVRSADGKMDCGQACNIETEFDVWVRMTATPDAGSVFTGWVADCQPAAGNQCSIYMDGLYNIYAVFDRVGDSPTPLIDPSYTGPPPTQPPPPPFVPTPPSPAAAAKYGGCTVFGTGGNDDLDGTSAREVFCTFGGRDHIHAGGGNDVIFAGAGNDVIEVHSGADRVYAGAGNDLIDGGSGRDTIFGGSGRDTIRVRDGLRDLVDGGPGRDAARADKRDRLRAIERRA